MAGTTYQQLLDGVAKYYGSGSDQWAEIAKYGVNAETLPIIEQVPGVSITKSNSGKFLGYDYNNPFSTPTNPVSMIDSNVQTGEFGAGSFNANLPATAVTNSETGITTLESGAKATSTGVTVSAIADKVSLGLAGVALGTKLGKFIDSAIYNANPDFWDENYPTINPETWDDMATTQGGKNLIRSIFGLKDDNATMYIDERMLAYTYMMLLKSGAYSDGGGQATYNPPEGIDVSGFTQPIMLLPTSTHFILQGTQKVYHEYWGFTAEYLTCIQGSGGNPMMIFAVSRNPFTWYKKTAINEEPQIVNATLKTTLNGTPYYECDIRLASSYFHGGFDYYGIPYNFYASTTGTVNRKCATIIIDGTVTGGGGMEGVNDNPNAGIQLNPSNIINPTTGQAVTPNDNPDDVLNALKTKYPQLFNDSVYEDVPQPGGTTDRITYIPVPYPNTTDKDRPTTDDNPDTDPQQNPEINPESTPEPVIKQLLDDITRDPTPPDTGGGDSPPTVPPTGTANALYSIYNPSQAELNSFGAWLWSSDFVEQLKKLFNDPMQSIIGLHKVYAPPHISGSGTIKVGYLNSEVSSNLVGSQYTTVDCGSVTLDEYFGNVFDYDPFTNVYIYLPFIGIEKLNTGDVMRSTIHVVYYVDVLTGACLADIIVTRDGSGGTLYTFSGNCAVQYPISSGSYMGIIASIASVAGGVVGTVASGGALAPVAMGAVGGMLNAHTRVQHSGGFSGNAGAMGIKTPYLIITRPQTHLADSFPEYVGKPANYTTTIGNCSGYVKVDACHVLNVPATDSELSEIETLLKSGIII